jgi:hypothetical protein
MRLQEYNSKLREDWMEQKLVLISACWKKRRINKRPIAYCIIKELRIDMLLAICI